MAHARVPGYAMTIRVYKIRDGKITEDSGVKRFAAVEEIETTSAYPPCKCPGHRNTSDELLKVGR